MKSLALVGFGVSNQAVYQQFKGDYKITIHNPTKISVPKDASLICNEHYLRCYEDIVFRSPSFKKSDIITDSPIYCESIYALNNISSTKICVTGSDGKTTTCSLIFNILSGKNAFLGGNIGTPLLNAVNKGYDFIVGELSSFQLLNESVLVDTAVITNITENHLDYHADMAEYIGAKESLLKNAKHIVLNYDDLILRNLGNRYKNLGRSVEFFSLKEKADAYLDNGYLYLKGIKLFHRDKIKLAGDFNISNALASILATYKHVSIDEICHGAISFNGVKNRLEFIRELKGIKFYNSSIDSTPSRTIATLSAFDINRCIVILGGRDKNLSYDILENHLKNARAIIIMGENREKILNALCSGKTILVNNMAEAVSIAYSLAHIGDNIILSPASTSFDMYENYIERGKDFIKSVNNLK